MRQSAPERCPSLPSGESCWLSARCVTLPAAGKRSDATASQYARLDQIFLCIAELAIRKNAIAKEGLSSPFFCPRQPVVAGQMEADDRPQGAADLWCGTGPRLPIESKQSNRITQVRGHVTFINADPFIHHHEMGIR